MSSKRIAINTMATYGRSVLAMGMALFSSRWVLNSLGQSDFWLYSVVGSIIVFLKSVMAGSAALRIHDCLAFVSMVAVPFVTMFTANQHISEPAVFARDKALAVAELPYLFVGRLVGYRYYHIQRVISAARETVR